jgi:hypothetical protein
MCGTERTPAAADLAASRATSLCRVGRDRTGLGALEAMSRRDVGEHIGIGDVLRSEEISLGDRHGEPVLRAALACGQDQGMGGLGRIGLQLPAEIEIQPGGARLRLGGRERGLRIVHAMACPKEFGNGKPCRGRIGQQQHRVMPDIRGDAGKALCQHLVEPVLPDEAPGAGDVRVQVDPHHDSLPHD